MSKAPISNALSIAGTDPSGGAGSQADLKTFCALGVFGTTVITALVAQNTRGVVAIHEVPGSFVSAQLHTLFEDVQIDTVKIGMLQSVAVVRAVAGALKRYRPRFVVLDPVMVATSGDRLLRADAVAALRAQLLPLVDLITPNLAEAAGLLGEPEATTEAELLGQLARLQHLGPAVLITGGHGLLQHSGQCHDLLGSDGTITWFSAPRVVTDNTHGTGCTLSAAIAALRPRSRDWADAIAAAKTYLTGALRASDQLSVGHGHGPVHHLHAVWPHAIWPHEDRRLPNVT